MPLIGLMLALSGMKFGEKLMDGLTVGRIVHYVLTTEDAEAINRRRIDSETIDRGLKAGEWPLGAQVHFGAYVYRGDHVAALVVRVWESDEVNLKCFLNGNDDYWVQNIEFGPENAFGTCHWIEHA